MKSYRFHPDALEELEAAFDWYRQQHPNLAERFLSAVEEAISRICERPEAGMKYLGTRRRYRKTGSFPYLVIYDETPTEVAIIAVAHGRRRPAYWRKRRM